MSSSSFYMLCSFFLENQRLKIHAAYFIKCLLFGVFLYLGSKQTHLFSTERRKKTLVGSYSCYLEICSKSLRVEYVIEKVMLTSGKGIILVHRASKISFYFYAICLHRSKFRIN